MVKIQHDKPRNGGCYGEFRAEAPKGRVWKSEGLHEFIAQYDVTLGDDDRLAALRDIQQRMADGTEPCPQRSDCEWCNGEKFDIPSKNP